MSIDCDDAAPVPRPTTLTLTCDGDHGLFGQRSDHFEHGAYLENMRSAMAAGWLERFNDQGRIFLCPDCSGKQTGLDK